MAKALRIAALVVAVAAAIPSGGTSLFATSLAGVGVTAAGGAALSAATAGMIASAVGLASGLVTALTAKAPAVEGGQTEWQSDPNGPIPIVFGDTLVSPSIVYRKTTSKVGGTNNKFQFIGGILSGCGPIESVDGTLIDGEVTTFAGDGAIFPSRLRERIYRRTQLGALPETSELRPVGPWSSIPGWTSASKLSGYGAVMVGYVFDGKGDHTFTQVPTTQFRLRGVKCYDARQDSTYPGGSGPHRPNDRTTWTYSTNPYVQAASFALGWFQGANEIRVGGVGMPVTSIDLPAFVEAANVADANGWVSGGRVLSSDDKWETMKALCQAGGGEPVRLGATLSCVVNTPRIPIGTITRDDLIGNASVTTTQTRRDRINGIIPIYRSEDHGFEVVPAGVVRNATFLAQDGGIERTKEVPYPLVQAFAGERPDQVAQLAGYDIANAREAGPIVFPLKLRWLGYRAGDCLTIEDTPEFGYLAGKDVIVLRRQFDPDTASVVLTMREETPEKHIWALGLTGVAAPTTDRNPVPEAAEPAEGEWGAVTRIDFLEGVPSGTIALTGSVADDTATRVLIEYRETGATDWIQAATIPVASTSYDLTGLSVDKSYDVAVSYFNELRLVIGGLTFDYASPIPTATSVTTDTSSNPPKVLWQMPEITGWSYGVVYRGTTSTVGASAAVSDLITGGLFEAMVFEDDVLPSGNYWWWVRIYSSGGTLLSTSAPATGTIA